MKILVTGGAGLVGSHAAEYFAQSGHKVVTLCIYEYILPDILSLIKVKNSITTYKGMSIEK